MTAILPLVHFTSFLVSAALIAFLLFKNSRGSLNRLCILLILADALWSFGYCFVHLSQSAQSAMFWINFSALGWGSFSIAGIYFYLALTHKDRVLKNKPLLTLLVLLTVFFIYQQWTGQMVAGVVEKPWGWAGVWSTSIYSFAFYGYFGIISLLNTGLAIHYYFQAKTPREKHVARLLSITAVTSLLLGSITDVILPLTGRTVLPQMADILGMIWEIGIFLSVTRYGLMSLTPVTASERILSTMTDALMLLDTHRIVKLANRAAVDVFETTESELIGTEFDSHVLEKVLVKSFLGDVSLSGKSATKEFTYLSRSGGQIQVQLSASNIIDNTKTASGFVVVARDITELKLAVVNLEQKNLKIL